MIKRILVPLDGSENADRALDMALELAQQNAVDLMLVAVVEYGFAAPEVSDRYFSELKAYHEKVLMDAQEKARKALPKTSVTTKLIEGYPSDKIVEVAKENKADLIVMGRRGQSHLRHTLLGSVSDGVADQSPCSVLIVK